MHQFLIGLHGDYIIPSTPDEYNKVLRRPDLVTSKPGAQVVTHLISNEMLAWVWDRLRDRLSVVHVTEDYSAHFYDMYINKHEGKHLTGNRVRILLLLLSFLLRDLIAPEVSEGIFCAIYFSAQHAIYHMMSCPSQVAFMNYKIRTAVCNKLCLVKHLC